MSKKLYLSHCSKSLFDRLIFEMDQNSIDPMRSRTILVPNEKVKEWLLIEIAKKKGVAMGLKVMRAEQFLSRSITPLEMFFHILKHLSKCPAEEVKKYLNGKRKRLIQLASDLSALFLKYFQDQLFLKSRFFEENDWQMQIFRNILEEEKLLDKGAEVTEPIICFGIDSLPLSIWDPILKCENLSIYLFSPCMHYWQDVYSDFERKSLNRFFKKKGASEKSRALLDESLRESPKNLSNWGRLGRETVKILDAFDFEVEEIYPEIQPKTAIEKIKWDFLNFQTSRGIKKDDSVKIILCGSSKLSEIEAVKEEIYRLKIPLQDIHVLSPDIEAYVPFIQYVFEDAIPYRITKVNIAPLSSFGQGLTRLIHFLTKRWDAQEIITLFETPSFYKKHSIDTEFVDELKFWIKSQTIGWGADSKQRETVLKDTFGEKGFEDHGSWEKGFEGLLHACIFYTPEKVSLDSFEQFLKLFEKFKQYDFSKERSPLEWASFLENLIDQFLYIDLNEEADQAMNESLKKLFFDLKKLKDQTLQPFDVIQHFLSRPSYSQIHSSHLHAVRFSHMEEGSQIPAKAIFLIGMDEETFPKTTLSSSLDRSLKTTSPIDIDRYSFLRSIFSASEVLRITYCQFSEDEGKPVSMSSVVQEMISSFDGEITETYKDRHYKKVQKHLAWPPFANITNTDETIIVSIADLKMLARHSWEFFLQKAHQIHFENEMEETFALQKTMIQRQTLITGKTDIKLPNGLLGEALKIEIEEGKKKWEEQLALWNLKPIQLILKESCEKSHFEGENLIHPPLEFVVDGQKMKVIGTIKNGAMKGYLSFYDHTLSSLLRVWPEALATLIVTHTHSIWTLKTMKEKVVQEPGEALKNYLQYYLHSLKAPSPLIPQWADAILKQNETDINQLLGKKNHFEDPIFDWVLSRADFEDSLNQCASWSLFLKKSFASLIETVSTKENANV